MSIERLVQSAVNTANAGDVLGTLFAAELATVLRSIERRLRPLVAEAADGNPTRIIRASQANRTRKAIEGALNESGYPQLAESAYGRRLDGVVERVLATRQLADQAARLSGVFNQRIAAIKLLHETDLLDEGDEIARALWQAVIRGVFGARSVDDILLDLGDILDASEPQIRTLYDTSVSIFGRQIEALQAGDDPDTPFMYAHVIDKKTRPFCRKYAGRVFLRSEIDQLDNGQIDNVFLTCGGYNCRGSWLEVSKFSELIDYIGTTKRVPVIQHALDGLADAA